MRPLISIIIPVYNAEDNLRNCIQSVINQTYTELEIIIINDGSTDESGFICKEYKDKYSNIIFIDQNNRGVSYSRNEGIEASSGEYITFVDSDDYIENNYIEVLYTNMKKYDTDLVIGSYRRVVDLEIQARTREYMCIEREWTIREFLKEISLFLNDMLVQGPCFKLFKANLIKDNKIIFSEDLDFGEDTLFIYNYLRYVKKIYTTNQVIYNYVLNNIDTLSTKVRANKYEIFIKVYNELENLLKKFEVYTEKNEKFINNCICNQLIYLNRDLIKISKNERKVLINGQINNDKIIKSFKENTNLSFFGKIIKILVLTKQTRLIEIILLSKEIIRTGIVLKNKEVKYE